MLSIVGPFGFISPDELHCDVADGLARLRTSAVEIFAGKGWTSFFANVRPRRRLVALWLLVSTVITVPAPVLVLGGGNEEKSSSVSESSVLDFDPELSIHPH